MNKVTIQPLFKYSSYFKCFFNFKRKYNKNIFRSGRSSLEYGIKVILDNNKVIKNILIPSLICDDILPIIKSFNLNIKYYDITNELQLNKDDIERKITNSSSILLVVNYFGFPSQWDIIKEIKNKYNCITIEDNAHSPFSFFNDKELGTLGDISFNSYRKTLPLLSGSELRSNNSKININHKTFSRFPTINEIVYSIRGLGLRAFRRKIKIHENSINSYSKNNKIDFISKRLLQCHDFDRNHIIKNRIKNYHFWENYLADSKLKFFKELELNSNICPYVFPCFAPSSKIIEEWIKWGDSNNINIIKWPYLPKSAISHIKSSELKHILCFPINHEFDLNEIIS